MEEMAAQGTPTTVFVITVLEQGDPTGPRVPAVTRAPALPAFPSNNTGGNMEEAGRRKWRP